MLNEATRQANLWKRTGLLAPDAFVAVNLSAKQFDQSNLVETVGTALAQSGLSPSSLELEITKTTMMRHADAAARVLGELRTLGVRVAIDDFGTGYSSLSQLKRLPLTKLKIDRSFVVDIPEDAGEIAITKAIIAMGQSLSMDVLAEGVETEQQKAFLAGCGCASAQGRVFSEAMSPEALERVLSAESGHPARSTRP